MINHKVSICCCSSTSICGRNWIIMRHGSWSKWYNSIMTTSDQRKHRNRETKHITLHTVLHSTCYNAMIRSFGLIFVKLYEKHSNKIIQRARKQSEWIWRVAKWWDSNPRHMMAVAWQQCHWLDDNDDTDRHWPLDILIPELIWPRDTIVLWQCDTFLCAPERWEDRRPLS